MFQIIQLLSLWFMPALIGLRSHEQRLPRDGHLDELLVPHLFYCFCIRCWHVWPVVQKSNSNRSISTWRLWCLDIEGQCRGDEEASWRGDVEKNQMRHNTKRFYSNGRQALLIWKHFQAQWSLWSGSDRSGPNGGVNRLHVSSCP